MKKLDWLLLSTVLSTFVIGFILYPRLPDQIPLHWNIHGEVDRYGDKLQSTFLLPGVNLLLFILLFALPKIDPRKQSYLKFNNVYTIFRWIMHIFLAIIYLLTLLHAIMGPEGVPTFLDISNIVPFFVSILFIIIGNYLGKIKDNFFVGIRTPWTLSSKEVWFKTHRLAGKLFVLSGILGMIGSLFNGTISFIMLIGPVMISSVVSIVYSYFAYQKEQNN